MANKVGVKELSANEMASQKKYHCFFFASVLAFIIFNNGIAINEEEAEDMGNHPWLTASLSSLLPSSTCTPFAGLKKNSSLQVIQRHGPCFKGAESKSSISIIDILNEDQLRVNSVHSKLSKRLFNHENMKQLDSANIPMRLGRPMGTLEYIVSVGLGNPKTDVSLIIDTGSSLTWTQCKPCIACYSQQEPIFDPSKSTTYSQIKCPYAFMCDQILSTAKDDDQCANSTKSCKYEANYADNSFSVGFLSKERLTVAAGDIFENFLFGCGHNNSIIGGSAGTFGLGRSPMSFVQQTADTYKKVFSYCLPSTASSVGHLTFGSDGVPENVQYTPFTTITPDVAEFYGINIVGITVGGTELSSVTSTLSSAEAIIDVGTIITRLPPSVYAALRSEFRRMMAMYPMASQLQIMDTCYDLSGQDGVKIPRISLVFGGGVKVDLDENGIIVGESEKQMCLAFAPNESDEDSLILGNVQQKTREVVYDLNAQRLGFGSPGGC